MKPSRTASTCEQTEKLNICLFAIRSDQEFAINRREQYQNSWVDTPTYDQHSYEQAYNQGYSDGSYQNYYTQSATLGDPSLDKEVSEVPIGLKESMEMTPLSAILQIRNDGFVHNFANEGIFYADRNAIALLESLRERTIGQVRMERPDVVEALML